MGVNDVQHISTWRLGLEVLRGDWIEHIDGLPNPVPSIHFLSSC